MSETIDQQDTDEALEPRALIEAVEKGNEDEVKRLIAAGVPVDETDNRGKNALVEAVSRCNETLVHLLVEQGKAFVNAREVYGRTPLFHAITKSTDIAKYLIEKGADVNLKDFSNRSPLSFFVENYMTNKDFSLSSLMSAKKEEVRMLTDPSKDVGHDIITTVLSNIFCKLSLMCACKIPKTRLVNQETIEKTWKSFIPALSEARKHFAEKDTKKEAILGDILKKCKKRKTFSTMCNSVIELLVKIGANPNFADSDGNTALHYAAYLPFLGVSTEVTISILRQLEKYGLTLNASNHQNQTPLLFCLSGSMRHLKEEFKVKAMKTLVEVCKFLITRGSSLKETTQDEETVFHLVIKLFQQGLEIPRQRISKDVLHETMNILHCFSCDRLNQKTTVNKRDAHLNSPLHYWATLTLPQNHVGSDLLKLTLKGILEHLIDVGATLNPRNEDEETPLHLCKTWNAVKLLADKGANLNDVDSSGRSPMVVAMINQTNGIKPGNNESVVRALVDAGADVNRSDNEGKTALFYAIQLGNNESVVRALVDAGADANRSDNEGKTALFYAVQLGNNESVVRALGDAGADVNRSDNEGKTALFYANQLGNNESVVRVLVDAGADVNRTGNQGKRPSFVLFNKVWLICCCLGWQRPLW